MFSVITLSSYPSNPNQTTIAANSRGPRYGEEGAVLLDFRQRHRPHKALVEAIGDDKTAMKNCPIWGIHWSSAPPDPLPEENKRNYLGRKARKQRRRLEAKMNAKVKVRVKVRVNAKARVAILKSGRERKPERARPLCRAAPIVLPKSAHNAPATIFPAPAPPTTQPTTPSKGRAPASCLPKVMAQAFSVAPDSTLMNHRPRAPAPTITSFYPPSHPPPASVGASSSGISESSQHALPGNVPQGCLRTVAQDVGATPAPLLQPPKLPTYLGPSPCRLMSGLVEGLEKYAASMPIAPNHLAPHGPCVTVHSSVESSYMEDNARTFAQSGTPSLYSDAGSRSPSMEPSSSPPSAWARTQPPAWVATPPPRHIAPLPNAGTMASQGCVGVTQYVDAACQDVTRSHRHLSGSSSSGNTQGLTPAVAGIPYDVEGMCVPHAHLAAKVNGYLSDGTACHRIGDQDPQDVRDMAQGQPSQGVHSLLLSAPSTASLYTDRERSDKATSSRTSQAVLAQCPPVSAPPNHIVHASGALKQSTYSELSNALQYAAHPPIDEAARREKDQTTSSWGMVHQQLAVIHALVQERSFDWICSLVTPSADVLTGPHRKARLAARHEYSPLVSRRDRSASQSPHQPPHLHGPLLEKDG